MGLRGADRAAADPPAPHGSDAGGRAGPISAAAGTAGHARNLGRDPLASSPPCLRLSRQEQGGDSGEPNIRVQLTAELPQALSQSLFWFPDFKSRREDLVHHYQSFLILFKKDPKGKTILDHAYLNPSNIPSEENLGDIREYLGFLLKCYQELIDSMLDLFDLKFENWYGIIGGYESRTETIMEGLSGYMIWWASKYGKYKHAGLQINYDD